jgi:hypothetical protein
MDEQLEHAIFGVPAWNIMSYMVWKKVLRISQDNVSFNIWFGDTDQSSKEFAGIYKLQILGGLQIDLQKVDSIEDDGK